jgi:hypothetical protein
MVANRVATGVTEGVSEKDEVVPQMDRSHESGSFSMPVLESDGPVCRENRTQSSSWVEVPLKRNEMNRVLLDRYLCPEHFVDIQLIGQLSDDPGYFRFGPNTTCYGRSASGFRSDRADATLYDALADVTVHGTTVGVPFNPTDVIDNLRLERYANQNGHGGLSQWERILKDAYYVFRPSMPIKLRKHVQRVHLKGWRDLSFPHWPVDTTVEDLSERLLLLSMKAQGIDKVPFIWFWPEGAQSCAAMTHDIETERGRDFCTELMNVDESFGIKASFQVVPEGRYEMSEAVIQAIRHRGFEINIQDLNHDGNLFRDPEEFSRRALRINKYRKTHGASGFRAAVLYRNLDWYNALQFAYDMSVPNVAHLDPQRGGCCTVMPYFFGETLEIPVTTTQDYTLFHLLNNYSLELWKAQIDSIVTRNGLVSFIVHPDYVIEERAMSVYRDLLALLREFGRRQKMWFALPGEIDHWWRARHEMRIVGEDGNWQIEGKGADHAKLAFARQVGDRLEYEVV